MGEKGPPLVDDFSLINPPGTALPNNSSSENRGGGGGAWEAPPPPFGAVAPPPRLDAKNEGYEVFDVCGLPLAPPLLAAAAEGEDMGKGPRKGDALPRNFFPENRSKYSFKHSYAMLTSLKASAPCGLRSG